MTGIQREAWGEIRWGHCTCSCLQACSTVQCIAANRAGGLGWEWSNCLVSCLGPLIAVLGLDSWELQLVGGVHECPLSVNTGDEGHVVFCCLESRALPPAWSQGSEGCTVAWAPGLWEDVAGQGSGHGGPGALLGHGWPRVRGGHWR